MNLLVYKPVIAQQKIYIKIIVFVKKKFRFYNFEQKSNSKMWFEVTALKCYTIASGILNAVNTEWNIRMDWGYWIFKYRRF